jgi:sugar phosphate isomerase/epimerase/nucleoside-diphosphate-sugar epimerase
MALLAVSNIAWDLRHDKEAYDFLQTHRLLLEVAPTRLWNNWEGMSVEAASAFCEQIPVKVSSLQALLFQRGDLALFTNGESGRMALLEHLQKVIDVAAVMCKGVKQPALVFGSPKQRRREQLSSEEAERIAVEFFKKVGAYAEKAGVVVCLEANPVDYGADFMTSAFDAAKVVRLVASNGIRVSFDTGCALLAKDDAAKFLAENADLVHHVQVAERDLGSFENPQADHESVSRALFAMGYARIISLEMRSTGEDSLACVAHAVDFIKASYRQVLMRPLKIGIIGAGWFGCHLALVLSRNHHTVKVFEADSTIFSGSSSNNQFRLHQGFHYPRSYKTRRNMPMHFYRFEKEYAEALESIPRNFYAVANDVSLVDFGTYTAVMSAMGIPLKIIHNPADHGVHNVEGMVLTGEKVFKRDAPKAIFQRSLGQMIQLNARITPEMVEDAGQRIFINKEEFDWVINCTYSQLSIGLCPAPKCFYELCLTLVYEDTHKHRPEFALTIMDGRLCSLYPFRDGSGRRLATLTSVNDTPLIKSESFQEVQKFQQSLDVSQVLSVKRPLFERVIGVYFPGFQSRYAYVSFFFSFKAKPFAESENRECFVTVSSRVIDVWSGKINAIFDAELAVAKVLQTPLKQRVGKTAALIGFTGFVGSSLARKAEFTHFYNSKNIESIRGRHFDMIVCAGAPGVKWKANKEPETDKAAVLRLMACLEEVTATDFVLISTIDVYPVKKAQAEEFPCDSAPLEPYGQHRLLLERFVLNKFPTSLVLRLPALFGAGLRKNYIFDLLNSNVAGIDPDTKFQWYDMEDLVADMTTVLARNHIQPVDRIRICNFFPEPISTREVISRLFPHHEQFTKPATGTWTVVYDLWTSWGSLFASQTRYMRAAAEIFGKLERYVQTELMSHEQPRK